MIDTRAHSVADAKAGSSSGNRSDCGSILGRPRWYAVRTKYRQTHAAALAIDALGFRAFLPWASFPLPNGARELRPLFGPVCFARFDVDRDQWGDITRLECVPDDPVLHLTDPARPTPIADRLIDAIHRDVGRRVESIMARHGRQVVDDPVAVVVSVGAEVRLANGPLSGTQGVVADTRKGGRLARIEIDGCVLPMWVPADRLELLTGEVLG